MRGLRWISPVIIELSIFCAVALPLAGCSRQQEQHAAEPDEPDATAAAQPSAVADVPAESSLAIKRGIAMLAQDRATFQPCGEKAELWLVDQTDGVLTRAFAGETRSTNPTKVYVEAYGERASSPEDVPAARAYGGAFLLEEVLYAGLQGEVKGCDAPAASYIVSARGNEPFWAAEVSESQMIWRQPDAADLALGAPQTQDAEGAVHYRAEGGGHQLELMIDAQHCRDSMSGEFFAYAAKAVFNGKQFSGCARVGE
jgi:uncharacterized membrane protein